MKVVRESRGGYRPVDSLKKVTQDSTPWGRKSGLVIEDSFQLSFDSFS